MNSLRVLIVDDEPLIRAGIRNGLANVEDVEIIGECESGSQAVATILSQRPDLVLLDVEMQDSTGLDVVEQVGPGNMPAVIFVTAYDAYAVRAFELNAVDYLLKPFDEERLAHSIQRVRERLAGQNQKSLTEQLQVLLASTRPKCPERLVIRNGERFDFVPVESIDWIESANNYVRLHCGAKEHLLTETLKSLEHRLNPEVFMRIHRRLIINLSRVVAVHPLFGGAYEMELRSGVRLSTGRQYKNSIRALVSGTIP